MGNLFSKSVPASTPEGIKTVLDMILREMFKRADFIDLYSLADPERCSRYIVVAESALKNLFVKVQLQPRQGADGTFMVQKLEGLQKRNPLGPKQTEYCRILAFYFIRIFQIYAALALSVLDSDLPEDDIRAIKAVNNTVREDALLLKPYTLRGFPEPKASSGFSGLASFFGLRGGALEGNPGSQYISFYLPPDQAGPYAILNLFLTRPVQGAQSMDDMRFSKYPDMLIPQRGLYAFENNNPATRHLNPALIGAAPEIVYTMPAGDLNAGPQTIHGHLKLVRDGLRLIVEIVEAKLESKPTDRGVTVKGELFYPTGSSDNPKSRSGEDFADLLVNLFKQVLKAASPAAASTIPFLQKFKLIRRFEGDVPIEGTRIIITNPKQLFIDGVREIPITYKDSVKLEKGGESRVVEIQTRFHVEKKIYYTGKSHEYTLTIQLEDLDIKPPNLEARLQPTQKTTSSTFKTGLHDNETPMNEKGQTVSVFMQRTFERLVSGTYDADMSTGGIEFKHGIPQPYNSKTLPDELKVKGLWMALAKNPPMKAYCVARAVQLLNVSTIRKDLSKEGYSEACRLKFPYAQEHYVPKVGESITDVPGIRAAELLFYDIIENAMPKIAATEKYSKFVKTMQTSFVGQDVSGAAIALKDVKDKVSAAACGKFSKETPIQVPTSIIGALRAQASEMLHRQNEHIPKVMNLLYKMFDATQLQQKRGLYFNAKFAAGGMPAVNALAEEARNLLMEYYSDCERLYKGGLALLATKAPGVSGPAAAGAQPRA